MSGQKKAYRMSKEEKEYLEQYDITRFDRPSIATDVAVFSIMELRGAISQEFMTIYAVIIAFYFGTQTKKGVEPEVEGGNG